MKKVSAFNVILFLCALLFVFACGGKKPKGGGGMGGGPGGDCSKKGGPREAGQGKGKRLDPELEGNKRNLAAGDELDKNNIFGDGVAIDEDGDNQGNGIDDGGLVGGDGVGTDPDPFGSIGGLSGLAPGPVGGIDTSTTSMSGISSSASSDSFRSRRVSERGFTASSPRTHQGGVSEARGARSSSRGLTGTGTSARRQRYVNGS